jgi:hypothetical protein
MILTIKSFITKNEQPKINIALGDAGEASTQWTYNRMIMYLVFGTALVVTLVAIYALIVSVEEGSYKLASLGVGFYLIGIYVALATLKEMTVLELLSINFSNLSGPARDEVLASLADKNNSAFGRLLGLLEKIFGGEKS